MSAMTMEFDGVRELSMEEVDAVSGARVQAVVRGLQYLGRVARDTAVGQAMWAGAEAAGDAVGDMAKEAYSRTPQSFQQGMAMRAASGA